MKLIREALLAGLASTLNLALQQDKALLARLSEVNARRFAIKVTVPSVTIVVEAKDSTVTLSSDDTLAVDATVEGDANDYIALLKSIKQGKANLPKTLSIHGDIQLIQTYADLMRDFQFDLESFLARWIGDTPAHEVAKGAENLKSAHLRTKASVEKNVREYLQEEWRILPCKEEIHDFFEDVDALRLATDRLEARFERLKATHDQR